MGAMNGQWQNNVFRRLRRTLRSTKGQLEEARRAQPIQRPEQADRAERGARPPPVRKNLRIEPKTFFANERTFLQWFNAAILLFTVGAALLNFNSSGAHVFAYVFLSFGLIVLVYSQVRGEPLVACC